MASAPDCLTFPDLPDCQTLFYYAFDQEYALVLLLLAFGFAFILAFAVGANDSANSWGTPVGAGTLSLGCAYLLGSICETIGATFLSDKVISGVSGKTSIINMDLYRSNETVEIMKWYNGTDEYLMPERELMLGCVISMIASQTWQLIATYLGWPVSGTHAIISSEMGFTLAENGGEGVNIGEPKFIHASGIYKVVYGLIIAPVLGFTVAFLFYLPLYKFVVLSKNPRGLFNRISYSICVFLLAMAITFFFIALKVDPPIGFTSHGFAALIGAVAGLIGALAYLFMFVPCLLNMRREMHLSFACLNLQDDDDEESAVTVDTQNVKTTTLSDTNINDAEKDDHFVDESSEIKRIFRPLQVLTACYGSINHGANDVANCIGPLVTAWHLYQQPVGYGESTLYGINVWGGFGISMGLICFGQRVIMTMGSKITRLTPSHAFTAALAMNVIVMMCSIFGIPASTTHCEVMAVVGAGIAKGFVDSGSFKGGMKTIDLHLIGNIALSWIITIPFAIAVSAGFYSIARIFVIGPF